MTSSCERFQDVLWKRSAEIEVPAEESQLAREHAAECADCACVLEAVQAMAAIPVILEAEAREVAAEVVRRIRRRKVRMAVRVATAVVASIVAVSADLFLRGTPRLDAEILAGSLEASDARVLVAGTELSSETYVTGGEGARLRLGSAVAMYVAPDSSATLTEVREKRVRVHLAHGKVAVAVKPRHETVITTPHCNVQVLGTKFSVDTAGDETEVAVASGAVEIDCFGKRPVRVEAGRTFRASTGARGELARARAAEIVSLATGETPPAVEPPVAPAPEPRVPEDDTPSRVKEKGKGKLAAPLTLDDLMSRARQCRMDEDWACALDSYRAVQRQFPDTPEATTVAVSMGQIELTHTKHPRRALKHFDTYLESRPGGALEPEALYGKALALRALARHDEEAAALRALLDRYPLNVKAQRAKQRLRELNP